MQQTQAEMMSSGRHLGIPASSICMPRKPGWETVFSGLERGHTEGRQYTGALDSGVLSVLTFDQTWDLVLVSLLLQKALAAHKDC